MSPDFLRLAMTSILATCLLITQPLGADQRQLDEAVKRYYAGYPRNAIEILEPLASSGDVEAQFLLGNILFSLSQAGTFGDAGDPEKWYRMAAAQGSADASYALGAILQNRWTRSGAENMAASAILHYRDAVDRGHDRARGALARLVSLSGISEQAAAALIRPRAATPAQKPETEVRTVTGATGETTRIAQQAPAAGEDFAEKSDPVVVKPTPAAPVTADSATGELAAVTLADIANQCQNYTAAGFDLYAKSIEGATFDGRASVLAIAPDESNPGNFSIELANNRFDSQIVIDLRDVPRALGSRFGTGKQIDIHGIIVESKAGDSGCTVRLKFVPGRA